MIPTVVAATVIATVPVMHAVDGASAFGMDEGRGTQKRRAQQRQRPNVSYARPIAAENIVISLHRVTTAFKTSGQSPAVVAGLLLKLRHPGVVALVVALLDLLRLRLALGIGGRAGRATEDRAAHGAAARIVSDDGTDASAPVTAPATVLVPEGGIGTTSTR